MTGSELEDLSSSNSLFDIVRDVRVFARVSPKQKLKIVEAAKKAGHFVAVTGDGVKDAPALQAAIVGIAMGKKGTDVAKDTSELVINDDNFATIASGIEQGRVAYDNIRKVIYLLVSTGTGDVTLVLLTILAELPLPLLHIQFLWA